MNTQSFVDVNDRIRQIETAIEDAKREIERTTERHRQMLAEQEKT